MKVLIAEDHPLIRKGLQLIVSRMGTHPIPAEAETADQLLDLVRRDSFDVLVTDLRIGDRSTLELLGQIRRERPSMPVLILSSQPEGQYAVAALRAGARGYVQKNASPDEIVNAIERVAAGRTHVSARMAEHLANAISSPGAAAPHHRLSTRELEVFLRIARGETNRAIAEALFISAKTVSTHRARILEKTGFRTNADIVTYAIRSSLVS